MKNTHGGLAHIDGIGVGVFGGDGLGRLSRADQRTLLRAVHTTITSVFEVVVECFQSLRRSKWPFPISLCTANLFAFVPLTLASA